MSRSPIVAKRKLRNARRRKQTRRWRAIWYPGEVAFRLVVASGPGDRFYDETRVLYPAKERP